MLRCTRNTFAFGKIKIVACVSCEQWLLRTWQLYIGILGPFSCQTRPYLAQSSRHGDAIISIDAADARRNEYGVWLFPKWSVKKRISVGISTLPAAWDSIWFAMRRRANENTPKKKMKSVGNVFLCIENAQIFSIFIFPFVEFIPPAPAMVVEHQNFFFHFCVTHTNTYNVSSPIL